MLQRSGPILAKPLAVLDSWLYFADKDRVEAKFSILVLMNRRLDPVDANPHVLFHLEWIGYTNIQLLATCTDSKYDRKLHGTMVVPWAVRSSPSCPTDTSVGPKDLGSATPIRHTCMHGLYTYG